MTKYVFDFTEGDKDQKDLLGGKGANLAEMTKLGLPVPPGFTITTEACREYLSHGSEPGNLRVQVTMALRQLEDGIGRRLGDRHDPLLVSVRSGAAFSMPGMMETVLNIGLNDASVKGLAEESGTSASPGIPTGGCCRCSARRCWRCPARCSPTRWTRRSRPRGWPATSNSRSMTSRNSSQPSRTRCTTTPARSSRSIPREQLDMAINAVFNSWNTDRARLYRRRERIPQHLGTAVNVCTMVFGNLGETSGTGVAFTRDPASGDPACTATTCPMPRARTSSPGSATPCRSMISRPWIRRRTSS